MDDRRAFGGVLYRLRTGCQWRAIPDQFASGPTCHRHFQQSATAGVFTRAFVQLLKHYDARRGIVWEWSALDSATGKAPQGGGSSPGRARPAARSSA